MANQRQWPTNAARSMAALVNGAPIRSRITPTMSWWSAPAAPGCARSSAGAEAGLRTPASPRCSDALAYVAAQGGIAASLGNMGEDDWRCAHVRHRQGRRLARRPDTIETWCACAKGRVRAEHWGLPFSRREEDGRSISARRRHDHPFRKGTAQRTCAAADRTGTPCCTRMYGQALAINPSFSSSISAIDLIMDDDGRCRGVIRSARRRHTCIAFARSRRFWRPAVTAALLLLHVGTYLHRRRERHGAARRPASRGHGVRAVPPTGIYPAGCLITEGSRGEAGISPLEARRFMDATRRRQGSASARRRLARG